MDLNNISPFIKTVYDVMPQLGFENITSTDIETVNKKITASGVMLTVGVVGELRGNIVYIMDKASSMKTASKMMMGMPVDTLDDKKRDIRACKHAYRKFGYDTFTYGQDCGYFGSRTD
mgnify:CR=1 FL=1